VWVFPGEVQIPSGSLCVDDSGACSAPSGSIFVGPAGIEVSNTAGGLLRLVQTGNNLQVGVGTSSVPKGSVLHVQGKITSAGNSECSLLPRVVGRTSTQYNGKSGGYAGANAKCAADFTGSGVCTAGDIMRELSCSKKPLKGAGWISTGAVAAYDANGPFVDDCQGWTTNSPSANRGILWADSNGDGIFEPTEQSCDVFRYFWCCQQSP